jgi:Sensors of blue-light using FAD
LDELSALSVVTVRALRFGAAISPQGCGTSSLRAVARTFDRIRASRRHRHIVTVLDRPTTYRDFAEWSMGLARPSASDSLTLWSARWQAVLASGSIAPAEGDGMALLKAFWFMAGGGTNSA